MPLHRSRKLWQVDYWLKVHLFISILTVKCYFESDRLKKNYNNRSDDGVTHVNDYKMTRQTKNDILITSLVIYKYL